MFKQQKGITLIALVITIIVLLILAGITIAMLTGSDSAPAKANEAKQKQDIGSAKDQVYMVAQKAQMDFYEDTYVKKGATTSTSATNINSASADCGKYVADELGGTTGEYKTAKTVGGATIEATASDSKDKEGYWGTITITTRDYRVQGKIKDGGVLVWSDYVGATQTATSFK